MSDNKFASIVIIIVLTICVALDALTVRKVVRIESIQVKSMETESEENRIRNYAEPYYAVMTDGQTIDNAMFFKYLLENTLLDRPVFVIRYSAMSCESCVQDIIKLISSKISDLESKSNILFVVSGFENARVKHNHYISLPREDSLGLKVEESPEPFVFVYDKCILHTYVPNNKDYDTFSFYLKMIEEKYHF